jgi:hypothetical protein
MFQHLAWRPLFCKQHCNQGHEVLGTAVKLIRGSIYWCLEHLAVGYILSRTCV